MSEDAKPAMTFDPEMLAAYIDKRLTPEQRAAVEAQLASDPDSYAVLVESLKALDALESGQRTVPFVATKKSSMKRWTIAGGVLAAAAALILVVRLQPDLLRRFRGSDDPRLERLIAAVDHERPIETRLTGGFKYAPMRPVTRGAADDNLELLAAAGELQRVARDAPTIENQHASAIALLLTGRVDPAIALLEQVDAQSAVPQYRSDLAAAYATRAQQQGRAEDWVRSLDTAERALALDPNLDEALFNRAVALDKLFLRQRAADAWQDYLRHDPSSAWAAEAKSRLQGKPQSWDERRKLLDALPIGALASADLAASNPQLVREWVEETVLGEWAHAVIDGNAAAAAARLAQAGDNAELVSRSQPETTFGDVIKAIRDATDAHRLAQAHLDFLEARRLYSQGAFANSADVYQRAYPALASAGSPLARTCQHYMALLPYFRGELAQASDNLRALEKDFRVDRLAEARRRWMLGIIGVGQGRYEAAVADYRSALATFEATHESDGIAGVHSALGEVLHDLGDREWWQHLRRATELTPLVRTGRRHGILVIGTQGLLAAGYPTVARHYQEETLRNALDGGVASMISEAFQWMYAVLQRQGSPDAAGQTLVRARQWIDAIPDEGLRTRQQAELLSLEADAATGNASAASVAAMSAIEQFTREGRTRRLPQLYLQLAKAKRQLNDLGGARSAIDLGLASVEQQRVDVREARLRVSYFEDKWGLVEEGLVERLASPDITPAQSLAFLDRWRRPSLFQSIADRADSDVTFALRPDVAVVAYAMLPDRLVVWVVRGNNVQRTVVAIERATIERLVLSLRQSVSTGNDHAAKTLDDLSRILLAPVWTGLAGASEIAISPDGVIGEVPFAALSTPTGDRQLIDQAAVVMVPSVAAVLNDTVRAADPVRHVLIAAVSRAGDDELPPLPGSVVEGNGVAAIYGSRADVHIDGIGVDEFRRLASSADIIHVAAHAAANPLLPHLSRVFLTPDAAHPSGVLTAAEISALKLRARLVVLSACETAAGTPTRSEGVIGLASAFMAAGASSVVASLWPADDEQSAAFQEHFHASINGGATVVRALRDTQLWARTQQRTSTRAWNWATWIVTQTNL